MAGSCLLGTRMASPVMDTFCWNSLSVIRVPGDMGHLPLQAKSQEKSTTWPRHLSEQPSRGPSSKSMLRKQNSFLSGPKGLLLSSPMQELGCLWVLEGWT